LAGCFAKIPPMLCASHRKGGIFPGNKRLTN
jgi:hypothetical protein